MSEAPTSKLDLPSPETIARYSSKPKSCDESIRAERKDAVRQFVRFLTSNANDPARIGKRVKVVEYMFEKEQSFPKLKTLASELVCSSGSLSRNITNYKPELESIFVNKQVSENERE